MGSFPATYNDPNYLAWILKQLVASSVQLCRSRRVLSVSADR